ncbi:MAG: AAA family ATPase [Planctomycetota bacterium]
MSRYFLKTISVEGFRGINNEGNPLQLRLKPDCVNSVFGHSGAGKSSLMEAVQYAITGSVRRLDDLHQDEHGNDYYVNRFHSQARATITLTFLPDDGQAEIDVIVTRQANGQRAVASPTHPDPAKLLASLNEELVLLDYRTFQRFVEDAPLKRGRSFAGLLGLDRVSETRQILEVLSNPTNVDRDLAVTDLQAQKQEIERKGKSANTAILTAYRGLFGRDPTMPPDETAIATETLAHLRSQPTIGPLIAVEAMKDVDFAGLRKAIENAEGGPEQKELAEVKAALVLLDGLAAAAEDDEPSQYSVLSRLIEKRDRLIQLTQGTLFKKLFESVLPVVSDPERADTRECPVCGTIKDEPIKHIVTRHLDQFREVDVVIGEVKQKWVVATFGQRLKRLEEAPLMAVPIEERRYSALERQCDSGTIALDALKADWAALQRLDATRATNRQTKDTRRGELEAKLPPSLVALTEQIQHAEHLRQAVADRAAARKDYQTVDHKLRKRANWKRFASEAARQFATLDTALAEHRTNQIRSQCEVLFADITRVVDVKPALSRSETDEALELRLSEFYGLQDLGAAALLSESYRNAFAISVFLSSVMTTKPNARFVILDDVTSSFDGGHQYFLLDAIRTKVAYPANPDGPQVIILSHDGLLEKHFDVLNGLDGWVHTRLSSTAPVGRVDAPALSADRLNAMIEEHLRHGRVGEAERLTRQYLEFTLQLIIRKVSIPVPLDFAIRENNRLPSDCIAAISAATTLQDAAGSLILSPQQKVDAAAIPLTTSMANWLSHYGSATTVPFTPAVVRGLVQNIDRYADCFRYDCRCDGQPKRVWYKSLGSRACPC